jgi:hypothetical protein
LVKGFETAPFKKRVMGFHGIFYNVLKKEVRSFWGIKDLTVCTLLRYEKNTWHCQNTKGVKIHG